MSQRYLFDCTGGFCQFQLNLLAPLEEFSSTANSNSFEGILGALNSNGPSHHDFFLAAESENRSSDYFPPGLTTANSPTGNPCYQNYFPYYGDEPSLEDLDLSTPIIPSTPAPHSEAEEAPAGQDPETIALDLSPTAALNRNSFDRSECSKTFDIKSKLTAHLKDHDKSLQCPKCDKAFGAKQQLKRHVKEVHERRRIPCPVRNCKRNFSRTESVKRHLGNKHSSLNADELLRYMR